MARNVVISKAVLEELYYQQGWTLSQIAAQFAVSRPTISNWMIKYGLPLERPTEAPIPQAILEQLYHVEGLTQQQIATQFGTTAERISQ